MSKTIIDLEHFGPAMKYGDAAPGWIRVPIGDYSKLYYDISPNGVVYYAGVPTSEKQAKIVKLAAWPLYEGEI